MEKVSIIIPVYNSEKSIERCLDSILNQSYKNLEVIIINDGSKDHSLEILKKYEGKSNYIKVISQENHGVSSARNLGLSYASGEYISFVDSDDTVEPNFIQEMMDNCKEHNAEICAINVNYIYDNYIRKPLDMKDEIVDKEQYFERLLYSIKGFSVNKLFKKSIIENIKFNDELKISEDFVFNAEVACNINKAVIVNKYLYNYYQDNSSTTHKKYTISNITELYALDRIIHIVKKQVPKLVEFYCLELTLMAYKQKYEYKKSNFRNKQIWKQINFFCKKYKKMIKKSKTITVKQKIKLGLYQYFYFVIIFLKQIKHSRGETI